MDMTDVIELFGEDFTLKRTPRGAGVNAAGVYVQGTTVTSTVRGHVQPKSGASQDREASGVDTDDMMNFWCTSELFSSNSPTYLPDIIVVRGQDYEVDSVNDWGALGNYWKATLSRKD